MNVKNALRSEDTEQIAVIQWAQYNVERFPELKWLHHIPNGGSRNKAEAIKLKQMGVKSGVSDLCLPYPKGRYCGLYIEMKYGNGRKQETQKEFLNDMAEAGHFVCTCYSAEEAVRILREYLKLERSGSKIDITHIEPEGEEMTLKNNSTLKNGKVMEE